MISPLRWFSSLSRTLPTLAFFAFFAVSTAHAFAYTTTLGSGVDPSAVSIAPSASATSSDSFTLQTDYPGSNTINSVIVDLGSTLNALAVSLIEITSDNGVTVYGSVANPSNATTSITLSGLAATSTSAQYKIRLTPKTHANMPPPNGQTYTVNARVSDWTDANATTKAGSDTGGTTVTIDNQSPTLLPNTGATWRTGVSAADNSWYSVAYGKGIFVGVSYDGTNRIMTSTDGINWTARTSPEQNMLMDVTYGNGMFVAVAQDGTYQVITSTDGINWTGRTTAPGTAGNGWLGVAYGNGRFVAVSQSGTYRAMYSTNGTTWTASTAAAANAWKGIAYGNGLFVAVAQTGTASDMIMTSPDGVTWTPRTAPEANQWLDVTYGGGLFVAVAQSGTNRVMTSPDGITWTARSVPASSYYWDGVAYGNGLFVAASYGTSGIITSPDGITWTARTPSVSNGWGAITYGNGLFVTLAGNGTGNRAMVSGTMMASTTPGDTMVTINYTTPADADTNSIVVLRSSSYNDDVPVEGASYSVGNAIGASTVACVDTTISASTSDACTATGLANGTNYYFKIFARDSNGNYSPGFTPPNLPSVPSPTTTIGDGTDPASATVTPGSGAVMADAFTVQNSSGSKGLAVVTVDLGSAEAASSLSLVEITSDDGATVYGSTANPTNATTTISTAGISITTSLVQLKVRVTPKSHANMPAVPGGTYAVVAKVVAVSNPNGIVYYQDAAGTVITIDNQSPDTVAPDASTWTYATAASVTDWISVTYGKGIFVAVACGVNATTCNTTAGTRVMTSSDGLNWTGRTAAADNQWQSVTYGNGLFVAVANSGTGNRVMTSPDGITWTSRTSAADNAWTSVTYGNGLFVAVANSGTGNRIMTSPDGITWTIRTSAADNQWSAITYGNGLFVAVSTNMVSSSAVMTSPDGITWTSRTQASGYTWYSIAYGNGIFVATGWGGTMSSPDGINWTVRTFPDTKVWNAIEFGNGVFVAVSCAVGGVCSSTASTRIKTTYDGITWTSQGSTTDTASWNSVAYGNGVFAAVSTAATGNVVMVSTTTVPTVAPGDSQVVLSYTTPGDGDINSIVVLRSTSPVTNVPAEGVGYSVGNTIGTATVACIDSPVATSTSDTCTATSLSNGTAYYFKLFAKDASGNYSTGITPAGLPVTPNAIVTIGDGTDPSRVTATPGGPAVMADAFTLQTSQGTKTISSVVVNLYSVTAASGIALIEITSDSGGVVYGSVANPTNATTSITLSTNTLTASSTPVQYKIRITPKTHANMPVPPGDTYVMNARIDSVVAPATLYAGSDSGGTEVTIDNQSPPIAPNDGVTWVSRATPADNYWQSVTYGNGLFVAVANSGTGNRVMTSPDGITWTSRTSAADNAWKSVTYGNGLFVAVACGVNSTGCNNTSGNRVMTSPDGITWTLRASAGDTALWQSVIYGNGLFVAVSCGSYLSGCDSTNSAGTRVMTSPDGITWTARTAASNDAWFSVTYGNDLFVAVSNYVFDTNHVMTSPDGITWTGRTMPGGSSAWPTVTYGNGLFVALSAGYGYIATSTDGITWTLGTMTGSWQSVTYGNGLFIAAGSGIMTSPDGINWTTSITTGGSFKSVAYGNGTFVAVSEPIISSTLGYRVVTSSSVSNPVATPSSGQATISYTLERNTQSVLVLRSTSPVVATPTEGVTYSVGNTIGASTVACVDTSVSATTTGSCNATGLSNGTPYYFKVFAKDSNGNYSPGTVPTGAPAKPNPSLVLGDGTDPSSSAIIPGSSGVLADSFTLQTSSGSDIISSLVVNLGSTDNASSTKLIEIVSDNGVTVYGSSTNPTNATTSISLSLSTLTANTTLTQYKIRITPKAHAAMPVSPGDKYLINAKVDSVSGNYVLSGSDNGGTTLTIDNQSPAPAVTDDTVWTLRTSAANNTWQSVTYGNGLFVAVANSGTGNRVMTSPDGITWTSRTSAADNAWTSVTYGNGLFVAVANSGTGNRIMTSPDGITWTGQTAALADSWQSVTYGEGLFVITGSTLFMTSPDGFNWTTRNLPSSSLSVAYGNGLFVSVGSYVMTSPDGVTWTVRTSAANNSWQSVTYGEGLFVAVSSTGTGNRVMTSPDGITWTAQTSAADNAWQSVTYGNGLFVAVANSGTGNRVMTSPDGITWTSRTSAADNAWTSVTYGNGLFVAVSSTGTGNRVMTSGSLNPVILPGYNQVTVSYTTPVDSDLESVIVLRSSSPITNLPAEGSTYSVGNTIGTSTVGCVIAAPPSVPVSCDMTGLTNGATYYFKVFTKDLAGNYSIGATPDNGSTSPGTITQLGTGSDPASTTIAPGGSAVMADSFTLKTSSGTDVVTSVVVNLGSVLAASSVSSIEIVSDNGVTVYGSSTNPTNATTSISLSLSTLTANTTLTQYKIRITPKTHTDMPSVPGATYPVTAIIDSFVSTNSHSGSDTAGTTISIDNESPSDVSANDGLSWISRNSPTIPWTSVTFGNGTFVAVAGGGAMTSPDGVTWTSRSPASGNMWTSVTYGNGLFVAVSSNGTGNRVMTSPNGITWTSRTSAADNVWTSVTYGNGLFVAVACGVNSTSCNGTSGNRVMTSPDGITWTQRADAFDINWTSVTYGNGLFVAVSCGTSVSCGGSPFSMISSDGITWSSNSLTYGSTWQSVTYGNGLFVAVADDPVGEALITSTDGVNWTLATSSVNTYLKSVTYGAGLFVAVSRANPWKVLVSPDGSAWTAVGSAANYNWYGVTYGNGKFVAVAQNGSAGIGVMTSDSSKTTVTSGNGQATVFYTLPSDIADLDSVVVLRSTALVTDAPAEGATYAAGNTIGSSTVACVDSTVAASSTGFCTATGLSNATPYYFKVFTKDANGNYSPGVVPGGSPVTPSSAVAMSQSGYRFFASSTSPTPGTAMATQNTAVTLANANDAFRMRLTLHAQGGNVIQNGLLLKLQYAQRSGTCDTSFAGEAYSDIGTSTPISYYNVPGLSDNSYVSGGAGDITHNADTVVNESYAESNPFKNSQATILSNQDGKFDFSLSDNGAPSNTPYCIRAVNLDGSQLTSYSVIPEVVTASQQVQVASYRLRKDDGSDVTATYDGSENGSLSSKYVVGDKLRIRFTISNTGSAKAYKSYRLEYSSNSCTVWNAVPRTIDVTNEHWKIETSPYVADYSSTNHSTGLTIPPGKTFVSGSIQTFNNTTQPIMLATNQYTEIEYSVRSTTNVAVSTPYCFRVSPVGDPSAITYVATPQVTPSARIFRYQGGGGGGGGGSQSASSSAEASASTATTTTTGGTTSGGAASSTESTATTTNQTSTSTPTQGGGSGDVGYLLKLNGNAYAFANSSVGIVLGDSAEKMCVDLKGVMMVGSRDQTNEGQVAELQYFLQTSGYFNSKVTGYFGKVTEKAVRQFQVDNGLPVTGIVGKATRNKMKQVGCLVSWRTLFPRPSASISPNVEFANQ